MTNHARLGIIRRRKKEGRIVNEIIPTDRERAQNRVEDIHTWVRGHLSSRNGKPKLLAPVVRVKEETRGPESCTIRKHVTKKVGGHMARVVEGQTWHIVMWSGQWNTQIIDIIKYRPSLRKCNRKRIKGSDPWRLHDNSAQSSFGGDKSAKGGEGKRSTLPLNKSLKPVMTGFGHFPWQTQAKQIRSNQQSFNFDHPLSFSHSLSELNLRSA